MDLSVLQQLVDGIWVQNRVFYRFLLAHFDHLDDFIEVVILVLLAMCSTLVLFLCALVALFVWLFAFFGDRREFLQTSLVNIDLLQIRLDLADT